MLALQRKAIETDGWSDIPYNFLVGGDGAVYVGRGWDTEGAHTKGYNKRSIGIAFIGTFLNEPPPQRQLEAAEKLIAGSVEMKKIQIHYNLYGHCQLTETKSPGKKLFEIIKTWEHWTPIIE